MTSLTVQMTECAIRNTTGRNMLRNIESITTAIRKTPGRLRP